jgi:hypothetical protein
VLVVLHPHHHTGAQLVVEPGARRLALRAAQPLAAVVPVHVRQQLSAAASSASASPRSSSTGRSIRILVGAFGAGSIVGSFDGARRPCAPSQELRVLGDRPVLLGTAPVFGVSLLGLLVMGIAHVGTATTVSTAAQIQVSDEFRGRVAVAQMQGILLGIGLGALVLAQIADVTSLPIMEIISAGAIVVLLAIGTRVFHGFRLLDPMVLTVRRAHAAGQRTRGTSRSGGAGCARRCRSPRRPR